MSDWRPTPREIASALEVVCTQWPDLLQIAEEHDVTGRFTALVDQLRYSADHLGTTVADLDHLLARDCAVPGGLGVRGSRSPDGILRGLGHGRPVEEAYVCPLERCPRAVLSATGGSDVPHCALGGAAMTLLRLDR